MVSLKYISIEGAKEHNLCNVSLRLPRDKLIVITGVSGSGKSSLAFDTLYAEGQRRYVDSLSAYARQFLQLMDKPNVERIDGLSPAISVEQKTTAKNPRSTVGTVTEIYDYLRLLFARIGTPYSPATGKPIAAQTPGNVADKLMDYAVGTQLHILAPVVRGRKGTHKQVFDTLQQQGFSRVLVDNVTCDIQDLPSLDKNKNHTIYVFIDRVVMKAGLRSRLVDSIETAFSLSQGLVVIQEAGTQEETLYSEHFSCPVSGFTLTEIQPRLFSFNSPFGACPTCDGLGQKTTVDLKCVVPDPHRALADQAVAPYGGFGGFYQEMLCQLAQHLGACPQTPFQDLADNVQQAVLYGTKQCVPLIFSDPHHSGHQRKTNKPFEGIVHTLQRRYQLNGADDSLAPYFTVSPCGSCRGYRLNPEALCVKIDGMHLGEVVQLSIRQAAHWIETLWSCCSTQEKAIAQRITKEIQSRLAFLNNVGLDYLTLGRASGTLSGGESQRIRLASQIGSGLTGVLYVLDEPSIGLHQRDNNRLLTMLKQLRDQGNTVIVVEHDEDAIRCADHVVDMGPGAGIHGGRVVAQGSVCDILRCPKSLTGQYLNKKKSIPLPSTRRKGRAPLVLAGATLHNLKNITVSFPLGTMICVTGVSGSGKSSLIMDSLYPALHERQPHMNRFGVTLTGLEFVHKTIDIDQSPIGRTPRSNPATYTGAFTPIREWFAQLPEAKARGYTLSRFSFNLKGGRCEACQGEGLIKIEMHFLPPVYVTCDQCQGKRYHNETCHVRYKGQSIADVLDMTVTQGLDFFASIPAVRTKLQALDVVGLGYVHMGQQATTLSGGEAQRVKLAKELSRKPLGNTVYILDEPTTGLHFDDVRKLLEVLHKLVDQGHTVIVIEHNLDVIKTADWIIDMGPEGGDKGGHIVTVGTPEAVAAHEKSYTGRYLKPFL